MLHFERSEFLASKSFKGCILSSKYPSYIKFNRFDFFTHSRQLKISENLEKSSKLALKDLRLLFSSYSVEREVWSRFVLRKILHLAPQGEGHILKGTKKELKEGRWQKSTHLPSSKWKLGGKKYAPMRQKTHKIKRRYCENQKSQKFLKFD